MQYVAGQSGSGAQATLTHRALPQVSNTLQHLFLHTMQWLAVSYCAAVVLASIDCARLMHALSCPRDGPVSVNSEFECI